MERRIPDPLTVEDLWRDPDLILALRARGRRMLAEDSRQMLTELFHRIRAWRPGVGIPAVRAYRLRAS